MNIYIWVGLELVSHMTDKYMLSPSTSRSPSSPANMSPNKSSILQLALLPKYVETLLEDQVNSAKQVQVTKNID